MLNLRNSDNEATKRDIPSFIEPRPPLITNPYMRPRPQKGINLLEHFEDSECDDPELVQVYLRLKPSKNSSNLYDIRSDRSLITSLDTTTAGHGRRTQHNVSKMYTFTHIFGPDSNQKEIFEQVVKPNLKKLPEGNSFTLLTYGASGSGKTFTLMGTVAAPGLVPRALEYVFKVVEAAQTPVYKPDERGTDCLSYAEQDYELQWVKRLRQISAPLREKYRRMSVQLGSDFTVSNLDLSSRKSHYVWVSFIEIYNEGIYDLLAPGDRRNSAKLAIREDTSGNVYVKGATQAFVRSGEEAYDIMVAGKHNLQVAATGIHAHSSRSHCIFTITMLTETESGMRSACVRLCDLAGCERAARTRNTGARMHESRAINSSLHVLERCLRMLRSKRTASIVVPYRESKLTRLLGAGLSGNRGEAFSIVVTINPSPEYASETKHVLQLAAVAKDIQINNTISDYPSSLESSSQDTTLGCSSAELMRLRADNERLNFELVQAHARNDELLACMEKKQASSANVMREIVEEAKAITTVYYEGQLAALQTEMEEMKEEYESKLNNVAGTSHDDTFKAMEDQVTELITEIAVLKEKLSAERLARATLEEEMQHLRACIEERDENVEGQTPHEDVINLSDSDGEEDPCNESLEPTFKKEDLNRSRIIRQSLIADQKFFNNSFKNNDTAFEKSFDIFKSNDERTEGNVSYCTDTANERTARQNLTVDQKNIDNTAEHNQSDLEQSTDTLIDHDEKNNSDYTKTSIDNMTSDSIGYDNNDVNEAKSTGNSHYEGEVHISDVKANISRNTYFINDNITTFTKVETKTRKSLSCETYNLTSLEDPAVSENKLIEKNEIESYPQDLDKLTEDSIAIVNINKSVAPDTYLKRLGSINQSIESNTSLVQFERLELEAQTLDSNKENLSDKFSNIKLNKGKKNYFDDNSYKGNKTPATVIKAKLQKNYFDAVNTKKKENENLNTSAKTNKKNTFFENSVTEPQIADEMVQIEIDINRSPSIVKEEVINDFEPSTIKKLLGEKISKQVEEGNSKSYVTVHDSIDIFEELDSPRVTNGCNEDIAGIEPIRKSIDNIVILDKKSEVIETQTDYIEKEIFKDKNLLNETEIVSKDTLPFKIPTDVANNEIHLNESASKVSDIEIIVNKQDTLEIITNDEIRPTENSTNENTLTEFENIFKDITEPRVSEFDLLVTEEIKNLSIEESNNINPGNSENEELKYNLCNKLTLEKPTRPVRKTRRNKVVEGETLLESLSKCESEAKPTRRNIRLLRKQNNVYENDNKLDDKLKDIANFQTEFSDFDFTAQIQPSTNISPEKVENQENSPIRGIQSCPSKRVTRSRRKLFTPRAEPLDESSGQFGDSSERVQVLRPSYHRPRARRKL